MLGMTPIKGKNAGTAAEYFGQSDGGYYLDGTEFRREWGGKAAPLLGLTGRPELEQFERLLSGLHPLTGKQLTARLTDDRTAGTDFTASLPKGVTSAIEGGDERIMPLFYRTANETMDDVQQMAMTRVRKGGKDADRVTGIMAWLMVEHPEGRPVKDKSLPEDHPWRVMSDWDRHLHFIVPNETWDDEEKKWKALKVKEIFEMRKYFSHRFDLRMSAELAELGYEIDTKLKRDGRGGMEYDTWDIKAAPGFEKEWNSVNDKNSRRHQEIEDEENEIVARLKARTANPDNVPDRLSAVARDKLAATTRLGKRKDLTLDDLREYWDARLIAGGRRAIDDTIDRARKGLNPKPESQGGGGDGLRHRP